MFFVFEVEIVVHPEKVVCLNLGYSSISTRKPSSAGSVRIVHGGKRNMGDIVRHLCDILSTVRWAVVSNNNWNIVVAGTDGSNQPLNTSIPQVSLKLSYCPQIEHFYLQNYCAPTFEVVKLGHDDFQIVSDFETRNEKRHLDSFDSDQDMCSFSCFRVDVFQ